MKTVLSRNFFRAVSATLVVALAGGLSIWALTGEAHSTPTFGKGDRLDIGQRGIHCSQQAWPYYEQGCLRSTISDRPTAVRVVGAERKS